MRWGLRAAGAISLVLGLVAWSVSIRVGDPHWNFVPSRGAALGFGLSGALAAPVVESLQRLIVRRPQPIVALDLLAADDAMRAASVHSLAGAGLGMVLLIIGMVSTRVLEISDHIPAGLGLAPFVLWLAALVAWRYYSYRAWRVRRPAQVRTTAP